jgi:hypothetical protein
MPSHDTGDRAALKRVFERLQAGTQGLRDQTESGLRASFASRF